MAQAQDILRVGDVFYAEVEELTSSQEMIVSYKGHLFSVKNFTARTFKKGDQIHLLVSGANPVQLQLYTNFERRLYERIV
jgi:exosome complex RNA-binding protein Rrp4